ncbi:hypothetical protein FRC04_011565 [Tulasnella sp. 424]|nr:hypothetical protein FRC04_011565 [Tulasnella sp. 424]
MDTASLVQPGRQLEFFETIEELPGTLEVPEHPSMTAGYADIYRGFWSTPQGERVEVAIKELKTPIPKDRKTKQEELKRKADLVIQTACGLEHLHSRIPPICHADIKPENVLINDEHVPALSDFGLSRVIQDLEVQSGFTTSETVKGTVRYMARELFAGENPSPESDVYAFGGLILTVMSGKAPFEGLPHLVMLRRVMLDEPPIPMEHPYLPANDPLWKLMHRCWNKDPTARPTMQEVRQELLAEPLESQGLQINTFTQIREDHDDLPQHWPSSADVEGMVVMSQSVFQWTRTATTHIGERAPVERLQALPQPESTWGKLDIPPQTVHNSTTQTSKPSTLSVLQSFVGNAAKLGKALTECQAAIASRCSLSNSLETILNLFPQCIWEREELQKPQYDAEASRSPELCKTLSEARTTLNDVIAQYTYISALEYGGGLAVTKFQFGVPCKFIFALQLKACMRYMEKKKKEKKPLYTREVATAMYDDIVKAAEQLDPEVACQDVVNQCFKLVYAIRTDTAWPQPYIGREADADLLLRLAYNVITSPTRTDVINSSTPAKVSRLRSLIVAFFNSDAKQVTPLISGRQVAFSTPSTRTIASPANTYSSLSISIPMTPSSVAGWYFGYQELAVDLEVYGVDVGKGGFSTVHKARWMNRDVAVKVIRGCAREDGGEDPSILRNIEREKRVWGDIYHQYILPVFGVADWHGQDALISTLRTYPKAIAGADDSSITEAGCGILYLHGKGIVHGDIRMGNILLSPEGEPLIIDFGLSKPVLGSFDTQPSTAFERSGTVRWMAPELHLDEYPSRTKRSDVWAFACTVLELFSGKGPYSELREAAFYHQINEGEPPEIPARLQERVPALWQVLKGCWAKRPEDRPPMEVILTSLMMIRTGRSWMVDAFRSS